LRYVCDWRGKLDCVRLINEIVLFVSAEGYDEYARKWIDELRDMN
jgi:hypothetical protein